MPQEWDYHRLCNAYREEKATNKLQPLAEDFCRSLQELVHRLEEKAASNSQAKKELEGVQKQARLLLRLRMQKIAMHAAIVDANEPEGLTDMEKEAYKKLREMYLQQEERLELIMHAKNEMKAEEAEGKKEGLSKEQPQKKKIKLLADIPQYRGADNGIYGPFSSGQSAELPEAEAKALLKGKLAEEIIA